MTIRFPSQNIFTILLAIYYRLQNYLWRQWAHLYFINGMKARQFKVGMAAVILEQHELGWEAQIWPAFILYRHISPTQFLIGLYYQPTRTRKSEYFSVARGSSKMQVWKFKVRVVFVQLSNPQIKARPLPCHVHLIRNGNLHILSYIISFLDILEEF